MVSLKRQPGCDIILPKGIEFHRAIHPHGCLPTEVTLSLFCYSVLHTPADPESNYTGRIKSSFPKNALHCLKTGEKSSVM